jgi:opacity protein-like surface antigen
MFESRMARAALLCLGVATPVVAQDSTHSEFARRSSGSVSFIQSRPLGGLSENIGFGYGANAAYLLRLDHAGYLSLRADAGFVDYGSESFRAPLSTTVGGRIDVKVSTDNYIVPLSIGPQLAMPRGPIRPYVNAGIAAQIFFTESGVEGTDESFDFANTTNQHDWTSTWVAGGGVYVPIYNKKVSVLIDAGIQYFGAGHARYLRPGSIQNLPNAQIRIRPLEGETRLALVHLGVRLGL